MWLEEKKCRPLRIVHSSAKCADAAQQTRLLRLPCQYFARVSFGIASLLKIALAWSQAHNRRSNAFFFSEIPYANPCIHRGHRGRHFSVGSGRSAGRTRPVEQARQDQGAAEGADRHLEDDGRSRNLAVQDREDIARRG